MSPWLHGVLRFTDVLMLKRDRNPMSCHVMCGWMRKGVSGLGSNRIKIILMYVSFWTLWKFKLMALDFLEIRP